MGISGLGGKAATFILSKHRNVVINTFDGENYSTINVFGIVSKKTENMLI